MERLLSDQVAEKALIRPTTTRRARTPTTLQMEVVECGAASLAMILSYYQRIVPLAELRGECGVSRDGSKASNLLRAARKYGLEAKGLKHGLDGIFALEPPFIVFWNFNHFLVVEGWDPEHVFLNDPASGHRTVPIEEFDRAYTGIVLTFTPGPEFKRGGTKPSLLRAVKARLAGSGGPVSFCILAGLLMAVPGLVLPTFTQVFLDSVIAEHRGDWLVPVLMGIGAAAALQAVLTALQRWQFRRLRVALAVRLSGQFFWHLIRLPMSFYSQRFAGEIASRSQLNEEVAFTLSGSLASTAIDVVMMLFFAILMFQYDIVLTLIGIAAAVINVVALRRLGAKTIEPNMRLQRDHGMVSGEAIAALQSMETLKASGQESGFFSKWSGHYAKATNTRQELELASNRLGWVPYFLSAATTAVILVVGGLRVIDGQLTIGMLVAFQTLMASFMAPVAGIINLGSTIQGLEGDLTRIDDVLMNPVEAQAAGAAPVASATTEPTNGKVAGADRVRLDGHVEFRKVTFGYSPLDPPLIEDFDLDVRPGRRVALVGGSGSGKTTVANLVCGLFRPWSGEITFDGIPRDQVPRDILLNSFAVVSQDIFLFAGSVRDNLTLWDTTVPDANLYRACADAGILDIVLALPGGFDGMLQEGGTNLSGGQRQRLEIARSLIHRPSILILDEATSALDSETEVEVDRNLRIRGCTCIIVAHRLSTIRDADEIIVLDRGAVIERGTHDQLWEMDGSYASLIRTTGAADKQSGGEG